eukprot:scaffold5945_cov82-Isochrysis_galbana.AAC.5
MRKQAWTISQTAASDSSAPASHAATPCRSFRIPRMTTSSEEVSVTSHRQLVAAETISNASTCRTPWVECARAGGTGWHGRQADARGGLARGRRAGHGGAAGRDARLGRPAASRRAGQLSDRGERALSDEAGRLLAANRREEGLQERQARATRHVTERGAPCCAKRAQQRQHRRRRLAVRVVVDVYPQLGHHDLQAPGFGLGARAAGGAALGVGQANGKQNSGSSISVARTVARTRRPDQTRAPPPCCPDR